VAKALIDAGEPQKTIRDVIGGPTNPQPGIRAYCVVMLDRWFPDSKIIERLESGELVYNKLNAANLAKLVKQVIEIKKQLP
jgi:hypothetical protein